MMTQTNAKTLTQEQRTELSRLLAGSAVNPTQSLRIEGTTVEVVASVWLSEEKGGCFDIHLTAFEPGVGRLSLEGVSVTAIGESQEGWYFHVAQTTRLGDLSLKNLASEALYYLRVRAETAVAGGESVRIRMSAPRVQKPFGSQEPLDPTEVDLAADDSLEEPLSPQEPLGYPSYYANVLTAAGTEEAAAGPEGPSLQTFTSAGGRLRATTRSEPDGRTLVAVETGDPALADVVVRFAFVDETGRAHPFLDEVGQERKSGEVTLSKVEDEEDLWEGRCLLTLDLSRPCSFLFETLQ